MQKRKLGTELEVSAIGLGCMGMTYNYGAGPEEQEALATFHRALDLGINFFDTAEVYGPFTNEVLVGKALKPFRSQVVIATKFGFRFGPDGKQEGVNGRPENVKAVADASLKRLGIDEIDQLMRSPAERRGLKPGASLRRVGYIASAIGVCPS